MDLAPIKTKRDYRRALKEIEAVMDAKRDTPEGDRLDMLVTQVESWEAKQRPPLHLREWSRRRERRERFRG